MSARSAVLGPGLAATEHVHSDSEPHSCERPPLDLAVKSRSRYSTNVTGKSMQIDYAASSAYENGAPEKAGLPPVRSTTRTAEPEWPSPTPCPDGCGALVWSVGDEQGCTLLLDTHPLAYGCGGYVVEPLYIGPSAHVALVKEETCPTAAKEFVTLADAWNWYGIYESTLVTSQNTRFGLHVLTCSRKTRRQRARATNGQTYGGCCVPRAERKACGKPTAGDEASVLLAPPSGQLYLFGTTDQLSQNP